MPVNAHGRFRLAVLLLLSAALPGCTKTYYVVIDNRLAETAVLELVHFRAADFGGTVPTRASDEVVLDVQSVSVVPGGVVHVKFSDATGGFWVRWRVKEPVAYSSGFTTIDLRDRHPVVLLQ